ncbi:hypothetical protein J4466_02255 [Candidatus Pacearchaeota archaeon]|nr:hypothetical protein [Candidatus Pacearchaeota archaeon]
MKSKRILVLAGIFFIFLIILSFSISAFSLNDFFKWLKGEKEVRLNPDENGLILYIPFNDSKDDVTGNYDTSCRSGSCPVQAEGKINNSYKFDGVNDYLKVIDNEKFAFAKGDNYTISAWVNISKKDPKRSYPAIIQKWEDTETSIMIPFEMSYENITGKIICGINNGSASISTKSNDVIQENQWNMITCIYNSSDIVMYVNGNFNNKVSYTILSGNFNNNKDIWIGSKGTNYGFLNASIDDVRIYNKALTKVEIENLYSQVQPTPAISACPDNQTILRLSSETNAHAGTDTNYPVKICYNNIFGKEYIFNNIAPLRTCNANNWIVNLSSYNNAHGLIIGGTTKVCYGDLSCRNVTGTCNATEKLIVSLSSSENAHLSNSSDYPVKICCSSAQANQVPVEICNNNIDDDNDNLIDCADIADCGSNTACLQTGNCAIGTTLCSDGICRQTCTEFTCNNNLQCEAGEGCQCNDCHGFQDSCNVNLTCSFRTNTCQQCPSGTAFNSGTKTCEPDRGIGVRILSPLQWEKFSNSRNITFNQSSYSMRKDLNITWAFGDGSFARIKNCLTNGNCNTTHRYREQAHYTIFATVREQGGVRSNNSFVDILVYKPGINVFAIITSPKTGERIESGEAVSFNASGSYAAKCDLNQCENGKTCYTVGELNCYNLPRPPQNYRLWFEWTFDAGTQNQEILIGTWNQNYTQVVEFDKIFSREGQHFASLRVGFEQ